MDGNFSVKYVCKIKRPFISLYVLKAGIRNRGKHVFSLEYFSLTKQPTFRDVCTGFPAKLRVSNERRHSILKKCLYPDLGSASD